MYLTLSRDFDLLECTVRSRDDHFVCSNKESVFYKYQNTTANNKTYFSKIVQAINTRCLFKHHMASKLCRFLHLLMQLNIHKITVNIATGEIAVKTDTACKRRERDNLPSQNTTTGNRTSVNTATQQQHGHLLTNCPAIVNLEAKSSNLYRSEDPS